jgi:hypothetical protein
VREEEWEQLRAEGITLPRGWVVRKDAGKEEEQGMV